MAAIEEPAASHRRLAHLLPLSPRVPSSTDRHFEQYLIDHHHYPKLPSIGKQPVNRASTETKDYEQLPPIEYGNHRHTGSINRLLTSEQYRRAQARLIEYRQHSKIPGVALQPTITIAAAANNSNESILSGRNELTLPLKEIFIDPTRTKQHQNPDELDLLVDDDSIFSDETDRRRRAKHWIKDHQFFFTEYQ